MIKPRGDKLRFTMQRFTRRTKGKYSQGRITIRLLMYLTSTEHELHILLFTVCKPNGERKT